MAFTTDGVQVRISKVQDKMHEPFFALQNALPHTLCAGLGEAVQPTYGDAIVQRPAVGVVLDPHLEAQGSEFQVERSGRVRATAHLLTPKRRRALEDSTMDAKHSVSLTSCHSPVVGSCRDIQPDSLDHLITSPRRSASSSLSRSRSRSLMRSRLCLRSAARSSSVATPVGASTCSTRPSASKRTSRSPSSSSKSRAVKW